MLKSAFVHTHDFKALINTQDFNFVVGRRGTGKTALFIKIAEHHLQNKNIRLYKITPEEHAALYFRSSLENIASDYQITRAICRVCWKANLLIEILKDLKTHWKINHSPEAKYIQLFFADNRKLVEKEFIYRLYDLLNTSVKSTTNPQEIPSQIAQKIELTKLRDSIKKSLEYLNLSVVFLFDGLDEGWIPSYKSVAILGGLASAISDLRDSHTGVHTIVFVRDNIFRTLATLDPDFSRHIEGNTLRLNWNEEALFQLVTERLKVSLSLTNIENNMKVWNRFAQKKLTGREGFRFCLQFTLYRPRDILVLLNQAFIVSSRGGRQEIIEDDIETSSRQTAQDRVKDLINEYSPVFPGIGLFIQAFKERPAQLEYKTIVDFLDTLINENPYTQTPASDFAILGSGTELFNALYSVGFLGLKDQTSNSFHFCHDGARSDLAVIKPDQKTIIHPCYWKALEITGKEIDQSMLININDEFSTRINPQANELRVRMLGQLVAELPALPLGQEGCSKFEEWVFRVVKILFSGYLNNFQLKPNNSAIQRRDIVATNMAEIGFWKRILEDYKTRQVIFEIKNYKELELADFRQVLSYSGNEYGKFAVIVNRSSNEIPSQAERGWIKEMYDQHKLLVFVVPITLLVRCISKLRNPKRAEYADEQLSKRLDTIVRSYLSLQHLTIKKKKRKKKN